MRPSYHKTLCLDFGSEPFYQRCLDEPGTFRAYVNGQLQAHPELFPADMAAGWCLHGFTPRSKKRLCG